MMRFGKFDSPILLEALGDLLREQGKRSDKRNGGAKRLATRAYLKASYEVKDAKAKDEYRAIAKSALFLQAKGRTRVHMPLSQLEARFETELDEAKQWYAGLEVDEKRWIASGADVDSEFSRKYYEEPAVTVTHPAEPAWHPLLLRIVAISACVLTVILTLALVLIIRKRKRNRLQSVTERAG